MEARDQWTKAYTGLFARHVILKCQLEMYQAARLETKGRTARIHEHGLENKLRGLLQLADCHEFAVHRNGIWCSSISSGLFV